MADAKMNFRGSSTKRGLCSAPRLGGADRWGRAERRGCAQDAGPGAHAVLVGRPLAVGAIGAGADGVRLILEQMRNELKVAMIYTGCAGVGEIGEEALWR